MEETWNEAALWGLISMFPPIIDLCEPNYPRMVFYINC